MPKRREGVTQLILIMVCTDWVIVWTYEIWALFVGRMRKWGNEDLWCPCQARPGLRAGCFLFFSRIDFASFKTVFHSLQKWGRQVFRDGQENSLVQGLGKARVECLDNPPVWPSSAERPPASNLHSITHLKMSFQILMMKLMYVDKTSAFHNLILMWFPLREC